MAATYAKLTIRASWSLNATQRGEQTEEVRFRLAGQWFSFRRGGRANEFVVPDAVAVNGAYTPSYMLDGITNLLELVRATIINRGLPYTITAPKHIGDILGADGVLRPQVEFAIEANAYNPLLNLDFFVLRDTYQPRGWVVFNQTTIRPLLVSQAVTHAGIYNSATGAVTLTADGNGDPATFTYAWADGGVRGLQRSQMLAGTYYCTVYDSLGEQTRVTVIIKQDPRLEVQVNTTPSTAELVPSGGLPPYSYAWLDGPTTAVRTGLVAGTTYECVVRDTRGATRTVQVRIAAGSRYWFSGNPVVLSLDAGAAYRDDPTTKPNLSFVCQVHVEQPYLSGNFVALGQALEQPADEQGRTTFEVQELLEPFVSPQLPTIGGVPTRADGVFCRFYLRYYERTTDGDSVASTVETNYLVHGGLDHTEAATGTWFDGYQTQRRPFLTWEPITKKVLPDQPEYLYFMVPTDSQGPVNFALRQRLHLVDGTHRDVTIAERTGVAFEIFCLPAGPAQLEVAQQEAAAGQLATRYELSVVDATGAPLSEVRTYVLDRRPCPVRRYFLYANSLGGWNTLVCRGRVARDLATKTTSSENARPAGYDPLRGDYTISRRTGLTTLKCYAGARTSVQLVADQDFLLSERVVLLEGGRYLAGQVKDRTVTVLDEDETRRVLQFDYELPRERYFTPRLSK
jgi:hypothetical protein